MGLKGLKDSTIFFNCTNDEDYISPALLFQHYHANSVKANQKAIEFSINEQNDAIGKNHLRFINDSQIYVRVEVIV